MKSNWVASVCFALGCLASSVASAQFRPPACGGTIADSTCYTTNGTSPSACVPILTSVGKLDSCPPPYSGKVAMTGTRDSCTGVETWTTPLVGSACTNCPNPLTLAENDSMLRSVLEVAEGVNLAMMNTYAGCSRYTCPDGKLINNPLTGSPIGHYFRDHVWISPEGFSSGKLPASNRVNYLLQTNQIPSNLPASPLLPVDTSGNPITNAGVLYLNALNAAISSGTTSCSGNDSDHCEMSCTAPSTGWQQSFCAVKTVEYWGCSDSYAVSGSGPGGWQPTKNVTVPFATSAASGAGNYTTTTWNWPTVFGWNGPAVNPSTGGNVFLCDASINTCNGWVTDTWIYQCRIPFTYDCSYTDLGGVAHSQTCTTCDATKGAVWDYKLNQTNDCPMTPVSTRGSNTRSVWMGDFGSCPILAGPVGPAPVVLTCLPPSFVDGTGTSCTCAFPATWNGSVCVAPTPPAGIPPAFVTNPLILSNSVPVSGAVLGALNVAGASVSSVSLSGGSLPLGMSAAGLGYASNFVSLSGIPTGSGIYVAILTVNYLAGTDSSGASFPAGSATATVSVTVTGCPPATESWASGSSSCSASLAASAIAGLTPSLSSTNGTGGAVNLNCTAATGAWTQGTSTCGGSVTCPMLDHWAIPGTFPVIFTPKVFNPTGTIYYEGGAFHSAPTTTLNESAIVFSASTIAFNVVKKQCNADGLSTTLQNITCSSDGGLGPLIGDPAPPTGNVATLDNGHVSCGPVAPPPGVWRSTAPSFGHCQNGNTLVTICSNGGVHIGGTEGNPQGVCIQGNWTAGTCPSANPIYWDSGLPAGTCGSAAGVPTPTAPIGNLCGGSSHTPGGVVDMGSTFYWVCVEGNGVGGTAFSGTGGAPTECSTPKGPAAGTWVIVGGDRSFAGSWCGGSPSASISGLYNSGMPCTILYAVCDLSSDATNPQVQCLP